MAIDESESGITGSGGAPRVSLSKWVNEALPPCQELLTARDVARLTRRHRWVLEALTLFGRFPAKRRFHGRCIGWRRHDVLLWLKANGDLVPSKPACRAVGRMPVQQQLDLGCRSCRRPRPPRPRCSTVPRRHRDRPRLRGHQGLSRPAVPRSVHPSRRNSTSHTTSETP